MIRIDRRAEPPALAPVRARALARAVLARRRDSKLVTDGYGLPAVRERLYEALHSKCAYCERPIGKAGQPIEHFRPKGGADRGDPFTEEHRVDEDRYWWMAWSWSNLLLSCSTCNTATFKGNRFPLEPGSPELAIPDGLMDDGHPSFSVGLERHLLLDPSWDDPMDHITWRPLDPAHPYGPWRAMPRTERGRVTIYILGLDGRNVDRAGEHVRHVVKVWIERVNGALVRQAASEARALWGEALLHLFAPALPFHAVSHDALDFFFPRDVRGQAQLELPRPGASVAIHLAPSTTTAPSRFLDLPEDVCLQILAEEMSTPQLISSICRARPSSLDDLTRFLDLAVTTVRRHCDESVRKGQLLYDSDRASFRAPTP